MLSIKLLVLLQMLIKDSKSCDCVSQTVQLLHSNVPPLIKNITHEGKVPSGFECSGWCVQQTSCVGFNLRDIASTNDSPNCQLTNTLDHDFYGRKIDNDTSTWKFYKHVGPRKKSGCLNGDGLLPSDSLDLGLYSISRILAREPLSFSQKLEQWIPNTGKWSLCWRASEDGWSGNTFHQRCDDKGPTLVIINVFADNKNYIFGGFTETTWSDRPGSDWRFSPGSFIYSLRNKDSLGPFKAPLKKQSSSNALFVLSSYGPTFGKGYDVRIVSNANTKTTSSANFGYTYKPPSGYIFGAAKTRTLLAGSRNFSPSEIEVLYLH